MQARNHRDLCLTDPECPHQISQLSRAANPKTNTNVSADKTSNDLCDKKPKGETGLLLAHFEIEIYINIDIFWQMNNTKLRNITFPSDMNQWYNLHHIFSLLFRMKWKILNSNSNQIVFVVLTQGET